MTQNPEPRDSIETKAKPAWAIAIPIVTAIAIFWFTYKYTLRAWFQEDDFAWLSLALRVHNWPDFLSALFTPYAQGTIRPISERLFFLVGYSLFGLNALPYRIIVFITQLFNITVLGLISYKLTRSLFSTFLAPALWTVSAALAWPLTWTSAYNEILCSLFFLTGFYTLIRYAETHAVRFYIAQWLIVAFGLGVLELMVLYPVLALLYAALQARDIFKSLLWLLVLPVLYLIGRSLLLRHFHAPNNIYGLDFGASMLSTLLHYWNRALGAAIAADYFPALRFSVVPFALLVTCSVLGFCLHRYLTRRDPTPLFCLAWFVVTLVPFLPIRNHLTDYYLTVPLIGLTLIPAYTWSALPTRTFWSRWSRAVLLILCGIYLPFSALASRQVSRQIWAHGIAVKRLIQSVEFAHRQYGDKVLVIEGVSEDLFWNCFYDRAFRLLGIREIYLEPVSARKLTQYPELGDIRDYTIDEHALLPLLRSKRVAILHIEAGEKLRDITSFYDVSAKDTNWPEELDLAHPAMDSMLGPSWYPPEGDYRWMPKQAFVMLGAPAGRYQVRVDAFCADIQVKSGPLSIWLEVAGHRAPPLVVDRCDGPITLRGPILENPQKSIVTIAIRVNRTVQAPPDVRQLGLAVRRVTVQQVQ